MKDKKVKHAHHTGGGAVYGIGMIGAAIYFFQHAANFGDLLLGLVKALFWPGILVYKAFELFKM